MHKWHRQLSSFIHANKLKESLFYLDLFFVVYKCESAIKCHISVGHCLLSQPPKTIKLNCWRESHSLRWDTKMTQFLRCKLKFSQFSVGASWAELALNDSVITDWVEQWATFFGLLWLLWIGKETSKWEAVEQSRWCNVTSQQKQNI